MRVTGRWLTFITLFFLIAYLLLASYQLGLPGLHYDEAKEAGINALELLQSAPVSAFRGATFTLFGRQLPLMVQDYIGALNVYLAVPFLAIAGVGVPNLRLLPVVTGLLALVLLERAVSEWVAYARTLLNGGTPAQEARLSPIAPAGLLAVALLALSPSFIFWSRQGIFVTNLTQPLVLLCLWQGLRWLHTGRRAALLIAACAAGFALYAKLLAIWIIAPFALLVLAWWLWQRRRNPRLVPDLSLGQVAVAGLLFLLPLTPLFLFNWRTGGTLLSLSGNLRQSYYGVDNLAIFQNLPLRAQQLVQVLRGDHFWYLGGIYGNWAAPWLAGAATVAGLWRAPRVVAPPLILLGLALFASLFTVSDLFITHYALLHPLAIGVVGIALGIWIPDTAHLRRVAVGALIAFLLVWLSLDGIASISYHRALARSGGLSDHSDASYHLAYHLRYNGLGAPIALDWGLDAPVRYLSEGTVRPIEIFGYASPAEPDAEFGARLDVFLENPDNVYLLRTQGQEVFAGRREVFEERARGKGLALTLEQEFRQRDGAVLVELWRAKPR